MTPKDILSFWFKEISEESWWKKDEDFDQMVRDRFMTIYQAAKGNQLKAWQDTAEGSLALVLILDQFSRNMFRGKPESFQTDPQALQVSKTAISKGFDVDLKNDKFHAEFLYMPYMHSENLSDQVESVRLFKQSGNEHMLSFAIAHHDIIERFGRYPHRNEILGRISTPKEKAFLKEPGSSF